MFKIRDKILVTFLSVVIIPLIIISTIFGVYTAKSLKRDKIEDIQQRTGNKAGKVVDFFRSVENDMISLSRSLFLLNMIDAITNKDMDQISRYRFELENLFKTFSEGRRIYDKICYIDKSGQEIIRVSLEGESAFMVPQEELQDRSGEQYFKKVLKLGKGNFSVSMLDLSRGYHETEKPRKPLLRCAMPVFDRKTQKMGILVLHVLTDQLRNNIMTHDYSNKVESYLLDKDGFYLIHTGMTKRWGNLSDPGARRNLQDEYPQEMSLFLSGQSGGKLVGGKFFSFMPIHFDPLDNERYWILMEIFPKSFVYSSIYNFYTMLSILALLLITGVVATTFVFSRKLTRPLKKLVKGITTVAETDLNYHIPVTSNDEIAFLTFSFNKMIYKLGKANKKLQDYTYNLEEKVASKTRETFRKARQQKIIAEIGKMLWVDLDIQDIMDRVVNLVSRTLKIEFCEILLLDKSQRSFDLASGVGWKEGLVGQVTEGIGLKSQAGYTLKEQKPIVVRDLWTETRFSVPLFLKEHGVVSGLSVPMIADGYPVGVMGAHTTRGREFSKADINFMESVAHLIAAAIERRRAEKEIVKGKEYTEKLIETAQDAIICIDEKGVITIWNKLAEKIFGYSKREIIGKPVTTIIPEKYKREHQEGIKRLLETGEARIIGKTIEVLGKTKEGVEVPIDLSLSFQKIDDKRYTFTAIIRDITFQKEAKKQLLDKAEELEKLNKELGDFVYIVSHDLKEPLYAIDGYMSRLSKVYGDMFDEKGERYLERIKANIEIMSKRISELMGVIKVGTVMYDFRNNESGVIVQDVVDELERKITENKINVTIQENLPEVLCDEKRLKDVFLNLITNAIKFMGDDKQRKIEIGCDRDGDNYKFFVEDTGIGIKEEYHEQIFKIFRRLKEVETEGTGVGLAIVKKIVEIHKGTIWIESPVKDGKGTKFDFTIPITKNK